MPLLEPIVEALKPSMRGARIVDGAVPENIQPILTLMKCRAVAFENHGVAHWEITAESGIYYIRVEQAFLGDDEAEWTKLIGMLLDYIESQRKKGE